MKYEMVEIVFNRHFPDGTGTNPENGPFFASFGETFAPIWMVGLLEFGDAVPVKPRTVNHVSWRGHHRRTATMISNQNRDLRIINSAQMFSDDPDKMLLQYVLSQSAREQNNRKLQEHLEKIRKFGGRPPRVVEYVRNWQRRESDLGEL